MLDRSRNIRFRKRKSPRGWIIVIILALALIGIKVFWFRPVGPVLTDNLAQAPVAGPTQASTPVGSPSAAVAEVSARPVLEGVLGLWAAALASGDYAKFHQSLAAGWRKRDTPQTLAQAYQPLYPYRELLESFPRRGKLVVLESRPLGETAAGPVFRDTLGPESPWQVRVEWRTGRSALGFNLNLVWEANQWRPAGLRVEVYKSDLRDNK
ncbi:MAG: hypothetical protein LBR11_13225 [Deltaproteobacteria bacterium]|jgi:hypothetical protein|nr:hypothetical protein [Deltaproteobacteria bacterium]